MNQKEALEIEIATLDRVIAVLEFRKKRLKEEISQVDLESSVTGRLAKDLYQAGWRLTNWGASLTDSEEEIILKKDGETRGYWADGTNRRVEEAFFIMDMEELEQDIQDEVLELLCQLTERGY